jgi:hypothetical protein
MHLMILLPAFLGWKPNMLFLVLKMAADILSFILYQKQYKKSNLHEDLNQQAGLSGL